MNTLDINEMIETTEKPETTKGYVERFGSELAIAFAKSEESKIWAKKVRAEKSFEFFREIVRGQELEYEPVDVDLESAFHLLREEYAGRLKEVKQRLHEIFLCGYTVGSEPAEDKHFHGHGLQRPSADDLKEFFWEGD